MKSEESLPRPPPAPPPPPASPTPLYSRSSSSSLFAVFLIPSRLFIRDPILRPISLYPRSLSSPRSYLRVLFFRLSSSCVALFGVALYKRPTNQPTGRPTDQPNGPDEPHHGKYCAGPTFNYYVMP